MECLVLKNHQACIDYCQVVNKFKFQSTHTETDAKLALYNCLEEQEIPTSYWAEDACDLQFNKY